MICRSLFDLEITLCWIDQLDNKKKNKAIQTYLEFNGIHPESRKKIQEWQKIIEPKFQYRKVALNLKIDLKSEIIKGDEHISFFDFLSKITHWNPRIIKDITGRKGQRITYKPGILTVITLNIALKSICRFTFFYVENLFKGQLDICKILTDISNEFQNNIQTLLKSSSQIHSEYCF